MQNQAVFHRYDQEQHLIGGNTPTPPTPAAPAPTPPPPQAAPTQPTPSQAQDVGNRLYAAQGQQSTVLTSNVNTQQGVVKKTLLGG